MLCRAFAIAVADEDWRPPWDPLVGFSEFMSGNPGPAGRVLLRPCASRPPSALREPDRSLGRVPTTGSQTRRESTHRSGRCSQAQGVLEEEQEVSDPTAGLWRFVFFWLCIVAVICATMGWYRSYPDSPQLPAFPRKAGSTNPDAGGCPSSGCEAGRKGSIRSSCTSKSRGSTVR